MENEFLDLEPVKYLTGYYDEDNPVIPEELHDIFMVAYRVDTKKPGVDIKEIYTFTTKIEQALKRFKLFPSGYALIKRFLTDDEALYKMAEEGTTKEWKEEDITQELEEKLKTLKFSDIYGDIRSHHYDKMEPTENTIPVTYTFNKPMEVQTNETEVAE